MRLHVEKMALELANPFKLSYGVSTVRENVLISISDGLWTGFGEAAVVPYYGHSTEETMRTLSDPALVTTMAGDVLHLADRLDRVADIVPSNVRAALDMALHDLWGQRLGHPLYRLWGLNPRTCPRSSYTVAMADDEADYRARLEAAQTFGMVKLKLGSGDWQADLAMVEIAREVVGTGPDTELGVDANGGWDVATALAIVPRLAALGVCFVEQPVARDDWDGWQTLRAALSADHPPLIADESVQGVDDLPRLASMVDGVNIKLAKCGGLRGARQMIAVARAFGLQIMIGCMVESSVAITAAAHLAPMADYADLDGNVLVTNDPYRGVTNEAGFLTLPVAPGLGVLPRVT